MKAIVGVDNQAIFQPALGLLAQCRFSDAEIVLAHVARNEDEGENPRLLKDAVATAKRLGASAASITLRGNPGSELIDYADDIDADLIAVQSERKGAFRSFFLGSTSRALALGARQSLLISKRERTSEDSIRAVFATDHSPYCDHALDLFLRMQPRGIASIHVLCAVALEDLVFRAGRMEGYVATPEVERRIQYDLEELNGEIASRLARSGYEVTHSAPVAFLADAINDAMDSLQADLLIMGSQGHGFIERVALGSSALHQVVSEPHSLLLLRPQASPKG